jgi:S-formylglutathione hydrolase FrmB
MRSRRILLALAALALVLYFVWASISSPSGMQRVAYTPASKECGVSASGLWHYCISKASTVNGALAYHFHGRNHDEKTWSDDAYYTAQIQRYWAEQGLTPPTIASISFGPVWLLTQKLSGPRSGLLDVFANEVIQEIEARTGKPKYRVVFGESMGGLNTLLVALQMKGMFKKAVSFCPPLYRSSFFVPLTELREFLLRTGSDPKLIYGLRALAPQFVKDVEEWKKISPLELLDEARPSETAQIYLSAGLYDKYGNYEGAEEFLRKAKEKKFTVQWRPLYGGHCAIDIASAAEAIL